ncbi:glucosaminidase domain and LysM peptidoglycan-binding domain-containing protein [Albibacterium profundi]|uniref:Peptidoglycan hydrolase n=1 Tax=Albibacterium profundi TaxID=3134906 RepID=A0ABV5CCY6_9SPHI
MNVSQNVRTVFVFLISLAVLLPSLSYGQKRLTAKEYIEKHKEAAIRYMEEYGVPASIILGIAYHESAGGNSKIARYLNNHFGIKGRNNSTEIRSAYKGYDSVSDSYRDFVELMERRRQYNKLIDLYGPGNYKNWVYGIARGGYAASKTWPSRVIAIIDKYELYELDKYKVSPGKEAEKLADSDAYKVKKGDTLSGIAKRHRVTVDEIKNKNGLTTSSLQIGQELML